MSVEPENVSAETIKITPPCFAPPPQLLFANRGGAGARCRRVWHQSVIWVRHSRIGVFFRYDLPYDKDGPEDIESIIKWVGVFVSLTVAFGAVQFRSAQVEEFVSTRSSHSTDLPPERSLYEFTTIAIYVILTFLPVGGLVGLVRAARRKPLKKPGKKGKVAGQKRRPRMVHSFNRITVWYATWMCALVLVGTVASAVASYFRLFPGQRAVTQEYRYSAYTFAADDEGDAPGFQVYFENRWLEASVQHEIRLVAGLEELCEIEKSIVTKTDGTSVDITPESMDYGPVYVFQLGESQKSMRYELEIWLTLKEDRFTEEAEWILKNKEAVLIE